MVNDVVNRIKEASLLSMKLPKTLEKHYTSIIINIESTFSITKALDWHENLVKARQELPKCSRLEMK